MHWYSYSNTVLLSNIKKFEYFAWYHMSSGTIFPLIEVQVFIFFPVSKTQCINKGGFYLRPGVYFQHFSIAPGVYLHLLIVMANVDILK